MSFRTVVINKHCKLDFRMNYMEIRQPEGKKRIYLDEIEVLIVRGNCGGSLVGQMKQKERFGQPLLQKKYVSRLDSCMNWKRSGRLGF